MIILITGANGFIGSYLTSKLRGQHELFTLVRRTLGEDCKPETNAIVQDLTLPLDYSRLPKRMDAVIHLAQSRSYSQFPQAAQDIFDVNVYGTFKFLDYARQVGVKYFIFASSGGVYGYSYEKFMETDPVNPLNFYLSSKQNAELLIANYKQFFRTVVFRFFFVYGPGQKGMLIPNLLKKVLNEETIEIEGNPGLRVNPIYVEDAIRVFEPALHLQRSDLFNVAGDENVTITDLVNLMEKVTGKKAIIKHTDNNPQGDLVGDNTRMKEVLGVYPKTSLRGGLIQML